MVISNKVIDKAWADGVGLGARPWLPSDHLSDLLIEDVTVMNVANDKSFYIPVGTEFDYLRGKGVKEFADKAKYPAGRGIWFKSVVMRRCVVDGVARKDNDKVQGAHTDGVYINGDRGSNACGGITDFLMEDVTFRNCDGSCMPILLQDPTKLNEFVLRRVVTEDSVVQKRMVLKVNTHINVMRFEDCGDLKITPDPVRMYVGRIEIVRSPTVNVKDLIKLLPDMVVFVDGKQIAGPTDPVVVPPPPPSQDLPLSLESLDARLRAVEQKLGLR